MSLRTLLARLMILLAFAPGASAAVDPVSQERIDRAWRQLRAGDAAAAAPDLVAAAGEMRHTPAILLAAAEALARTGRPAEAVAWLDRAAVLGGVGDLARLEEAFRGARRTPGLDLALARLRANASPIATGTAAFTLEERDLLPESVAYDPASRSFFVGSLHKRKIVRIDPGGAAGDFVPQARDGLWTVIGMKVHPRLPELWANACNAVDPSPPMTPEEPATVGQAGVFRFDLATGRLVSKHLAGSRETPVCFNDLAFTPDGTAWITTGPDGVWRLRPGAAAPERVITWDGFLNGIAASDDGARVYLADHLRGVQILDPATLAVKPLALPDDATLSGIDGLYVRGRTLVAVQNGLGKSPERVVQAGLDPSLSAVACLTVLDRNRPEYDIPTTGVLVGDDFYYVASSQLRSFENGRVWPAGRLKRSIILRTPLVPSGCPAARPG